ncbi:short chain alcohol dehydrogenase isoform X2 [Citrus sinensis]|uniref:xanthoxin dehydrogenase isoform X2 n=1 Tax=Citrus clementina TaxID=85681 RepID=UPI000CED7D33|nr:xanthoxin dehydrogenase isoform X2 [Citrus x clementina]XP_024955287.1 short chain alcohol dehydrogenase isoform X2 [Citrus sinensis]
MSNSNSTDSSPAVQRLVGRVALITGGATGIGESTVRLFHKHGAKVCIADVQDNLGQQGLLVLTSVRRTYQSLRSVAGAIGGLGPHAYTGSKHAVLGLNKNVAAELGKYGIRVNCVSPYAVATGLALAHLPEEERTEDAMVGFRNFVARNANMQGTELTANDVANAVLFLASDEARYISGTNLMVDGGFTSVNHSLRVFR